MAQWEAALEEQVKLLRFWRDPRSSEYSDFFASEGTRRDGAERMMLRHMPTIESHKLERAEPTWIDSNVVDLISIASESIRLEPFKEEDLFTPFGFALLDQPFYLRDVHDKRVSTRAFSWGAVMLTDESGRRQEPGINFMFYTYTHDIDDYNLGPISDDMDKWAGTSYTMNHTVAVSFGSLPGFNNEGDTEMYRFMLAFFKLANQRIFTRTREHGQNRAERRRIARLRPGNDGVLVVELRRPRGPQNEESESDVHWSRQWIVGGHWRNQWYPSLNEHRQVWIAPYVKGPEDKPLVLHSRRAFTFTR